MNKLEKIKNLINEYSDDVDFSDFGEGVSLQWIDAAEQRLKVKFPPSYIWWLKNYGGGQIFGEEIFSVYEVDFDKVVGGDIVYINELDRKNKFATEKQLVIQQTDRAETFYFDLSAPGFEGEYPVYVSIGDNRVRYADDFIEFLIRRITE